MSINDETHGEMMAELRKMTATKVAEQIASIQPLGGEAGSIFAPYIPKLEWTEWRKTTSIWPRLSINDKIIFGRINKRSRPDWTPIEGNHGHPRVKEFATNKELFTWKLRGEDNGCG